MTYKPPDEGRRPLVYASQRALEQAAEVLPGRVIENEVAQAIASTPFRVVLGEAAEVAGAGWKAKVVRSPSPLTEGRRCWRVVHVWSTPFVRSA